MKGRLSKYTKKEQKQLLLIGLIDNYYRYEPTGGTCHVLLDDGNYNSVKHCVKFSTEEGDIQGELIAKLLTEFNEEEVEQICERPWEISQIFEQ